MNRRKNDSGSTVSKIVTVALAAVVLLSLTLFFVEIWERNNTVYSGEHETLSETLSHNGQKYVLKDNLETLLVLGLDKFQTEDIGSYNNDKQADFLLLFVMDKSTNTCKVIHINRDTMAEMNILGVAGDKVGTVVKQLALSHTYGNGREVSCRNAANAVAKLLMGVRIDHYVSVTMDAVPTYNDLVGGITLEILDDFTSIDPSMVLGETVTLEGEQALLYVRSRYGLDDPTNNNRMKRQKQYMEALYERSRQLAAEDENFISRAALKMTDYLVSDCSGNKLEALLQRLSAYEIHEILDIDGKTLMGEKYLEFYADEGSVKDVVIDCFYEPET